MKGAGVRKQFKDIIDVTSTVYDITGITPPASFAGLCQMPLEGKPIRAAFGDAASPDPRDTQYSELWGSRGIWHKGWKAVGMHAPGTDFDKDRWELHDVRNDFSESVDLASQQPARLEEMKKLWVDRGAKIRRAAAAGSARHAMPHL
jgi:arylsulfatase